MQWFRSLAETQGWLAPAASSAANTRLFGLAGQLEDRSWGTVRSSIVTRGGPPRDTEAAFAVSGAVKHAVRAA